MEQQDKKREQIIEAALKRFAHFGLSKTTMNEISADLNFSKALLYYYFPDKINLYAGVLEKIFSEVAQQIDKNIAKARLPEDALKAYMEAKNSFLEKYFPILDFSKLTNIEKYQDLKKIIEKANQSEITHLKQIINIGIQTHQYKVTDATYTAQLLFDAIQGIRVLYFNQVQVPFGIDKKFIRMISERQKEIVYIFLKGLSC